jgi:hypothetical protein
LYGTNKGYQEVVQQLERSLSDVNPDYVKVQQDRDHTTYVLSDVAIVGITHVSAASEVAAMWYGEEVLVDEQGNYQTLYSINAEHSYGDCAPHPWWSE